MRARAAVGPKRSTPPATASPTFTTEAEQLPHGTVVEMPQAARLNGADGCYVGRSFPDVVRSFCFPPPHLETKAGQVDLTAGEVVTVLPLGAAGSLISVAHGHSWFLVDRTDDLPSRVLAVDNETNVVARSFAVSATPPPFDMAAVIADSLWVLDVGAGELRRIPLDDL